MLSKATFDQCFGWREDQSSDVRRVDSAEPSRVKQISYDHNENINPSLPCDTFTRSPRMTMASNEEYQDVPAVGRETKQRATVFTVTGFPVPLQETRAATLARKQEQNFGIRRDNNVVGIDRTSAPWNTASALIQSEKPVTRLTDNGKIIRHNDDDWQRIENALDSDRRRRYFYVTERIIRGESQRLPHAYFHPRHHHHQLPHPSTTMSQSTEAPPACLKLMSSRDDGNDRDVMRPITRGEDRLEYELPAVACCINASSLDAASTIVSRHDVLTSDKPMNQTERNSGGQTQNTKEHGPDDSSEAQSGFEFPKITELLWTLPCPRPPKNNAMTTSAKLPTRTFAVSGITQKNDGKRDGSRRQPTSISRDNDESREREGSKGVQINSSYAEGSFRQAQNSDRPQDKGDVKRNVAQLSADRIGVDRCHPSKNTTLMRGQDDSACADRQVTCKQFKVTIFGQRQMKDRRVDANETAAKKATTHREEQFERLTNSLAAMRYIDDDDDEVSATCNSVTHMNDVKRSVTGFQPFSFGSESCPELRSSSDDMLPPVGRKRRVRFTLREKRAPQCGAVIPSTSQDDGDLTVTAGCRITRSRKCAKPDDQDTPVNYLWNQIIRSDGRCNATNASQREASGTAAATGISKLKNVNKSVEKTALTSSQSVDLLFDLLSADYKLRSSSTGSISSLNDHLSNPPQWNSRAERKRVSQYQVIDDSQVHFERNRPVSSINSTGVTPVLRIGDMQPPNDRSRSNDNDDDFASHDDDDGCRRKSIKELVESFEEMSMPLFKFKAKN